MPEIQPPLFLQTGEYTAADDRFLIGAMLFPQGGATSRPRPGVRAQGLSGPGGAETSLRVTASGSDVVVAMGSAFVPASPTLALNGVYLVATDGDTTVSVGGHTATARTVQIAAMVIDPEDDESGEPTSEAVWRFLATEGELPPSSLLLAEVNVPATSGALTVTDRRTFTTGLGGAVPVDVQSDLQGPLLSLAPYGSLAYVLADGTFHLMGRSGWMLIGGVPSGGSTARPSPAFIGQTFFDQEAQQLLIFTSTGWQAIGSRHGLARRNVDTVWGNRRQAVTSRTSFWTRVNTAATFLTIDSAQLVNVSGKANKPTNPRVIEARVLAPSANTLLHASVFARMTVRDTANNVAASATGMIALELLNSDGTPVAGYTDLSLGFAAVDWMGQNDRGKARTLAYSLPAPGEYVVRPRFYAATAPQVLEISELTVEVSL